MSPGPDLRLSIILVFVAPILLGPGTSLSAGDGPTPPLKAGDYAVYVFGTCSYPTTQFYPPFFGFADAADPDDQVRIGALACPVTLRWDVLEVTQDLAKIRIGMSGWFHAWNETMERHDGIWIGSKNWHPERDNPIFEKVNATLNANHTILVDLSTMEVSTLKGSSLGRWAFHVPTQDVIEGRTEVLQNWYGGTVVPANVSVGRELWLGIHYSLRYYYNVQTFVSANIGQEVPFPEGLDRYITYVLVGGWRRLPSFSHYYDASTSLLLTSTGNLPDDLLFNLHGILWIPDLFMGPATPFLSGWALVETNIVEILHEVPVFSVTGKSGGDGDGGGTEPGGGSGSNGGGTGGGGAEGPGGDGGVTEPGTGDSDQTPLLTIPWTYVALGAAIALPVVFTVLWRKWSTRPKTGSFGKSAKRR